MTREHAESYNTDRREMKTVASEGDVALYQEHAPDLFGVVVRACVLFQVASDKCLIEHLPVFSHTRLVNQIDLDMWSGLAAMST